MLFGRIQCPPLRRRDPLRHRRRPGRSKTSSTFSENLPAMASSTSISARINRRGGSTKSAVDEGSIGALSAFRNVGRCSKDGILGTSSAPMHMVTAEGGHFKEQLWQTVRALGLAFLLISGVGALIEDRGIGKGLGSHEEVQPSLESNTKFSDVKGVDEQKLS